ncbi:MAG: hypothetical protein JJ959_11630 [Nisaea sp.]|uniref:hypothetical protein n=1 Tax=Nisaea sp. TaxID=2024842 RepID=UPI001B213F17|nr:hypothetical protein [Nisaea sp.]MBO6561183.1 hypothetical protein [Nisaea sp.]
MNTKELLEKYAAGNSYAQVSAQAETRETSGGAAPAEGPRKSAKPTPAICYIP